MMGFLADTPIFWKGVVVVACALILFVGSVYVLLSAVFGLKLWAKLVESQAACGLRRDVDRVDPVGVTCRGD